MKEADGVVNTRDRYFLRALNSAQSIVKEEQHNGINTSESHGPQDSIGVLEISVNDYYWKLLDFLV